jgi:hypothetical protein
MARLKGFFRRHDFFDPRPSFWYLSMAIYFVDVILLAIPFSIPRSAYVYVGLALGFAGFPGFIYAIGELSKDIDKQDSTLVRVRNVMTICVIAFVIFGLLLGSINNMVASVGGQIPIYSILRYGWRFAQPIVTLVFGIGAVLIHRRLPFSPFRVREEEPVKVPSRRRSPAWFLSVTGILLIFIGLCLGLFYVIAFEALVLLVTGLILLPTGFLIRRITHPKSANSGS